MNDINDQTDNDFDLQTTDDLDDDELKNLKSLKFKMKSLKILSSNYFLSFICICWIVVKVSFHLSKEFYFI